MNEKSDERLRETPTEARQAEKRRSPRRALIWGTVLAVLVLAVIWIVWAQSTGV